MICDLCGEKGAQVRAMSRTYGKGPDLLLVENVPVVSCPNCGGTYLDATTMHELDRIKRERKRLEKKREIAVVRFAKNKARLAGVNGSPPRGRA